MRVIITFLVCLLCTLNVMAQQPDPWKKEQIMPTKELATKIESAKDIPLIINVGPMENIKTAIQVGAVNTDAGMAKLKSSMATSNKTKEVVIYCGCCSYDNCPNIRPAYKMLVETGFKHVKVLDIPEGIKPDWVAKGYPVE